MQDYMERRMAEGAPWTWSALHPNPVCGLARGSFMNLTTLHRSLCLYLVG